jgi:predicted transcriptional regulator
MLGVRLDEELEKRLADLAERHHRSKSYLAKEALKRYIEEEESKDRAHSETVARWEKYQLDGEHVGEETMKEWLESWGEENEKPCPVK